MTSKRTSGILAPIFSLPGVRDLGSFGRSARNFLKQLQRAEQRWWQILPLNPTDQFGSPYAARSAFAGETLYLDLEELYQQGLLDADDIKRAWLTPPQKERARDDSSQPQEDPRSEIIDYERARARREPCWRKAFERFQNGRGGKIYRDAQEEFQEKATFLLDDYALFQTAASVFRT